MNMFTVFLMILSAVAISMSIVNFVIGMHDTGTWLDLQSKVDILEAKVEMLEEKEKSR